MKAKFSIYILIIAFAFSACKKSNTTVTLVKTRTSSAVTDTFYYDSQHWITAIKGSDGSSTTFTKSGSTIIQLEYTSSNVLTHTTTFYLNAQSLVDSSVIFNNLSNVHVYVKG